MIVIQWVSTSWTKASRGHPGSSRRNAIQDGYPLPSAVLECASSVFSHQLQANESSGFELQGSFRSYEPSDPLSPLNSSSRLLKLELEDHLLSLHFTPDSLAMGAPSRRHLARTFKLRPGEWVRLRMNGRHTDYHTGTRHYSKQVCNVALVSAPVIDLFTSGTPTYELDGMARLF